MVARCAQAKSVKFRIVHMSREMNGSIMKYIIILPNRGNVLTDAISPFVRPAISAPTSRESILNSPTDQRIDDLVRSCERHEDLTAETSCPLCQVQLSSLPLLRRHLGKHQEEISLFALPSSLKKQSK